MFDIPRSPSLPTRRPARQLWLLALVVGILLAALGTVVHSRAAAPSGASRRASGSGFGASGTVGTSDVSAADGLAAADVTGTGTGSAAGSPESVTSRHLVTHTMSMDAPIQHGLTAHQEQAISARILAAHHDVTAAPAGAYWTPAMGRTAVARAESWLGMPYSWAGGTSGGPSAGRCVPGSGGDLDCHVVGFDCSGLMMYAWGAYTALPHLAATQLTTAGAFHPTLTQLRPGDLVFFAGYLPGGTGHVAIYTGHGDVIEAPESGWVVHRTTLASVLASDGAYRGAVRPLTGTTPALAAAHPTVTTAGGLVTLHGTNLAAVDAVHVGDATLTRFAQHSDSSIVVRVPVHAAGTLKVALATPWGAVSRPGTLTYTRPVAAAPVTAPTTPVTLAPSPPPTGKPTTHPTTHPTSSPTSSPSSSPAPTSRPTGSTKPTGTKSTGSTTSTAPTASSSSAPGGTPSG